MASNHYNLEHLEEIEVTVKVKVELKTLHEYNDLSGGEIADNVEDFKRCITEHLTGKLIGDVHWDEVTMGCDGWSYEVKETE